MKTTLITLLVIASSTLFAEYDGSPKTSKGYQSRNMKNLIEWRVDSMTPEVKVRVSRTTKDCNLYAFTAQLFDITFSESSSRNHRDMIIHISAGYHEMWCPKDTPEKTLYSDVMVIKGQPYHYYDREQERWVILEDQMSVTADVLLPEGYELEVVKE